MSIYVQYHTQKDSQTYFPTIESVWVPTIFLAQGFRPGWKVHFKPIYVLKFSECSQNNSDDDYDLFLWND